jgi:hypothetical protein
MLYFFGTLGGGGLMIFTGVSGVVANKIPVSDARVYSFRPGLLQCLLFLFVPAVALGDIPSMSGGGNFTNGSTSTVNMKALQTIGARALRLNLYPNDYWSKSTGNSRPERIDEQMQLLYQHGLNPILILFEYYGNYSETNDAPRDSVTWFLIGRGFAQRWRPNSEYLISKGIRDWGIQVFQAINEPDGSQTLPVGEYVAMLKGLAAGVHSIDSGLAVIPGGFMSENAGSSHTLRGYGTAIAPLLNDGTLDGIDLHTYNDTRFAPIEKTETGEWFWQFSPQSDFDEVKAGCGITRDINFYASEYGFKNNTQGITPEYFAKKTLTCIWGNLAVTRQDGRTPATKFALIWQLFRTESDYPMYGLAQQVEPDWIGNEAGKTFQMAMHLAEGMEFTSINESAKGVFVLEGNGRKMLVWQNLRAWTDVPGSTFTITETGSTFDSVSVYRWNSWNAPKRTMALSAHNETIVDQLTPGETYMFVLFSAGRTTNAQTGYSVLQNPSPSPRTTGLCFVNKHAHTVLFRQSVINMQGRRLQPDALRQSGTAGVWLLHSER